MHLQERYARGGNPHVVCDSILVAAAPAEESPGKKQKAISAPFRAYCKLAGFQQAQNVVGYSSYDWGFKYNNPKTAKPNFAPAFFLLIRNDNALTQSLTKPGHTNSIPTHT